VAAPRVFNGSRERSPGFKVYPSKTTICIRRKIAKQEQRENAFGSERLSGDKAASQLGMLLKLRASLRRLLRFVDVEGGR
jgi:hypothetical protein